jgi:signal transduction histidine kinase
MGAGMLPRRLLQQVLDVLPEAILIADTTPTFILQNRAAVEILGIDIAGRPVPMEEGAAYLAFGTRHLDGTPLPSSELPLERALTRGEVVQGEQFLVRNARNGRDIPVLANSAPLRDPAGLSDGAVVIFQDITAIKALERTREEFLSSASHDLKGPLTGIRGFTQLALRRLRRLSDADAAMVVRQLEQIESATARMQGLIDELLDATRQELDQQGTLDRRPTDLVALLTQVVETYQPADQQRIELRADLHALTGIWDATRLDRVFSNLIANAIKYSPSGPIRIEVTRRETEHGETAVVAVEDRGLGIPAADLPHIFKRYYRGSNVVGHLPGTGVGLAGSRQIVEQHGGTIEVRSTERLGSTFTVTLPLQSAPKTGSR